MNTKNLKTFVDGKFVDRELTEHENQQDLCYVLALLMIRRRILRLEESECDDDGHEVLVVYCPRKETEFRVRVFDPDQTRIQQIAFQKFKLKNIFCHESFIKQYKTCFIVFR